MNNEPDYIKILEEIGEEIKETTVLAASIKPSFRNDYYYTSEHVCKRLEISKRTLHEYRVKGIIPYIKLGGKYLYRNSDIMEILKRNFHEAFREFMD